MRKNTFRFPFLIRLSAGDWWVLISERRGRELSKFSFGVYGSRSGTLILGFLSVKISLVRLACQCGRLQPRVPVEEADTWVCTDKKLFRLGDIKFSFGDCTPAYRTSILLAFLRSIIRVDAGRGW